MVNCYGSPGHQYSGTAAITTLAEGIVMGREMVTEPVTSCHRVESYLYSYIQELTEIKFIVQFLLTDCLDWILAHHFLNVRLQINNICTP